MGRRTIRIMHLTTSRASKIARELGRCSVIGKSVRARTLAVIVRCAYGWKLPNHPCRLASHLVYVDEPIKAVALVQNLRGKSARAACITVLAKLGRKIVALAARPLSSVAQLSNLLGMLALVM